MPPHCDSGKNSKSIPDTINIRNFAGWEGRFTPACVDNTQAQINEKTPIEGLSVVRHRSGPILNQILLPELVIGVIMASIFQHFGWQVRPRSDRRVDG